MDGENIESSYVYLSLDVTDSELIFLIEGKNISNNFN